MINRSSIIKMIDLGKLKNNNETMNIGNRITKIKAINRFRSFLLVKYTLDAKPFLIKIHNKISGKTKVNNIMGSIVNNVLNSFTATSKKLSEIHIKG